MYSLSVKISLLSYKSRFAAETHITYQREVNNAVLGYLKKYMFPDYENLSISEKSELDNIPEKLSDWEFLTNIGCITHDTGLHYFQLKEHFKLKLYDYSNEKFKSVAQAASNFMLLMVDYYKMNGFETNFVYSEFFAGLTAMGSLKT